MIAIAAALALSGCASRSTPHLKKAPITAESRHVLVVYNRTSADGKDIADYYVAKRGIPDGNVVAVDCADSEETSEADYRRQIQDQVRQAVDARNLNVDYIVLTRGVPIRISGTQGYAVDAWLAAMDIAVEPIQKLDEANLRRCLSPYFGSDEPFSHAKFGLYLVTRLDGYTAGDCKALVDRSLAAKPAKGPFLLDEADNRKTPPYSLTQAGLERAGKDLASKGFEVDLDRTKEFAVPREAIAGYASWGSNDSAFDLQRYRSLRFAPGALCETFVSTSGRTFRPTTGGQSLIADLIAQGATGAKGYVSEPYTFALAKPELLFDRYTDGRNLAESFYAASQFIKWKDVVIGDPLCSPYAAARTRH